MESRLLCQTEQYGRHVYTLTRPAETIAVRDIIELPLGAGKAISSSCDTAIGRAIEEARRRTGDAFGDMSLSDAAVVRGEQWERQTGQLILEKIRMSQYNLSTRAR